MSHAQFLTETTNTQYLLSNLNLAIDEARLVREILELNDQLRGIEHQQGAIEESRILQKEIDHREDQLVVLRSTMDTVSTTFRFC